MRISDWSSDVCSSDLDAETGAFLTDTVLNLNGSGFLGADVLNLKTPTSPTYTPEAVLPKEAQELGFGTYSTGAVRILRSEEPTSELQSLMRISYAVFCLKKKNMLITNIKFQYTHHYELRNTKTKT